MFGGASTTKDSVNGPRRPSTFRGQPGKPKRSWGGGGRPGLAIRCSYTRKLRTWAGPPAGDNPGLVHSCCGGGCGEGPSIPGIWILWVFSKRNDLKE